MAKKKTDMPDQPEVDSPIPDSPVTPISGKMETITLVDEERALIRALEANLGQAKTELAHATMQLLTLQDQQRGLGRKVAEAATSLQDRVRGAALAHGIAVDDPSKGRWDLNTSTGIFTKIA